MAFIDGAIPWRRPLPGRAALDAVRRRVGARTITSTTTLSWVIVALVVVLNLIGLVMILSASSVQALTNYGSAWYVFERQFAWAIIGAIGFFVSSRLDYRIWQRHSRALLALGFLGLFVVLVPGIGVQVEGARRWIGMGAVGFQPSELAKVVLLVFTADVLTRRADRVDDTRATVVPVIAVLAIFAGLVMAEPDLATSIELGFIVVSVLIVAGVPGRALAKVFGGAAVVTGILASSPTAGSACSRSCIRGTTSRTRGTRSRSRSSRWGAGEPPAPGSGTAGRSGSSSPPRRPTSSSRSSAKSSACSARS